MRIFWDLLDVDNSKIIYKKNLRYDLFFSFQHIGHLLCNDGQILRKRGGGWGPAYPNLGQGEQWLTVNWSLTDFCEPHSDANQLTSEVGFSIQKHAGSRSAAPVGSEICFSTNFFQKLSYLMKVAGCTRNK